MNNIINVWRFSAFERLFIYLFYYFNYFRSLLFFEEIRIFYLGVGGGVCSLGDEGRGRTRIRSRVYEREGSRLTYDGRVRSG